MKASLLYFFSTALINTIAPTVAYANHLDQFAEILQTEVNSWIEYSDYAREYTKSYDTLGDELYHYQVYKLNRDRLGIMRDTNPLATYSLNWFGDIEYTVFDQMHKGYSDTADTSVSVCGAMNASDSPDLADSIDWRDLGAVTPVKNQGSCGSCWSFSATEAIEGAWQISTGGLVSLSEQQMVDCSIKYGNMGCYGGIMDNAFEYVIDNGGLCTEEDVPYVGSGGTCGTCVPVATISSCVDVTPNNESELKRALNTGPVSVAIEADKDAFQLYTGGIITSELCGTALDHGVLVVGYGTDNGVDYWTIKNSWGSDWGEDGYVRIARDDSNVLNGGICGIASLPSYPVV
jgi:C1A family cysteine protease